MKSFRLDPESVKEFRELWPFFLVGSLVVGVVGYFSLAHWWGWVLLSLVFALNVVVFLRGLIEGQLRRKYPSARHLWLLSIGMTTMMVCVPTRMVFPRLQGFHFDVSWLGVTYCSILAFVVINRKNSDIFH